MKLFRKTTPDGECSFQIFDYGDSVPAYDAHGLKYKAYTTRLSYSENTGSNRGEQVDYVITAKDKGEDVHNLEVIKGVLSNFSFMNLDEYERVI